MELELFQTANFQQYKAGVLLFSDCCEPSLLLPFPHVMTDTEKKSASSHEEYRGDSEKGAHVDLNANISARSVYLRCCRDRVVLVPYSLSPG